MSRRRRHGFRATTNWWSLRLRYDAAGVPVGLEGGQHRVAQDRRDRPCAARARPVPRWRSPARRCRRPATPSSRRDRRARARRTRSPRASPRRRPARRCRSVVASSPGAAPGRGPRRPWNWSRMSRGGPGPQKLMPTRPRRPQHPVGLVERRVAAAPDPVDRHDGVEAGIGPGQLEHRAHPQVGARRAVAGHRHELGGGVDARDLGSGAVGETHGESRSTGDVQQRHAGADPEPGEERDQDVERVVLVEAGPVDCPVAPRLARLRPVVGGGRGGGVVGGVMAPWWRPRPDRSPEDPVGISWRSSADHHPVFMTARRRAPDSGASGRSLPPPAHREEPT